MEKDIRKKAIIPFITFLGFIAISISSLAKGIDQHQTRRIVLASAGGLFFAGFAVLLAYNVYRNGKTAAKA